MTSHLEAVPEFTDTIDRPAWWYQRQWLSSRPESCQPRRKVGPEWRERALAREHGTYVPDSYQPGAQPCEPRPATPGRYRDTRQASGSCTYVIGAEGANHVKIGSAKEPEKRVANLQTGSPAQLKLLWVSEKQHERSLHRHFKDYRVRGEWFDLSPLGDPVEAVKAAVEEIEAAERDGV